MWALRPSQIDATILEDLYINQRLSIPEIAKVLRFDSASISRRLSRLGIPRRSHSESIKLAYTKGKCKRGNTVHIEPELLRHLYSDQKMTMGEISRQLHCSRTAVSRHIVQLGIKRTTFETKVLRGTVPSLEKIKGWKGGRIVIEQGYVKIRNHKHPRSRRGYILEHILVWEDFNEQRLPDGWVIHHLNGVKDDNRPENLVAMPDKRHRLFLAELSKRIRMLEVEKENLQKRLAESKQVSKK